jgi:hypothetical protein
MLSVTAPKAADLYSFMDGEGSAYYSNVPGEGRMKVHLPMEPQGQSRWSPLRRPWGATSRPHDGAFLHGQRPWSPAAGMKKTPSKLSFSPSLDIETCEPIIASASQRFAVDPDLIRAIIKAESNFNHRAVSPKGALGLMQLMPATAQEMGVANPFDPEENIHAGVMYLGKLLQLLNRNLPLTLAAYNAGAGKVFGRNEIPPIEETRNYVQRVMTYYKNFKRMPKYES